MAQMRGAAFFALSTLLWAVTLRAALPEPARQHEPWTPPPTSTLPDYVFKVAGTLFDAGLADPRGGTYREVEIFAPNRDKGTLETHAWVFPGGYAVCWNGLVYHVKAAGLPADLDRDVRAILASQPWSGVLPFPVQRPPHTVPFWSGLQRGATIAPASIALLARVGRVDLAGQLWQVPQPSLMGDPQPHAAEEDIWLSTAASAWFQTAFMRLYDAFTAADDQEAADIAESLLQWRDRVPLSWRERKNWQPLRIPDISVLASVPAIFADARRRLGQPARQPVDLRALSEGKADPTGYLSQPQAARIADLIGRLQDVRGDKVSIPGPLFFSFDPVCALLIKEGEGAVDALLDAYDSDRRLTRTFDYSRPWIISSYFPVAVHEVVQVLLTDILGDLAPVQNATPAELRTWWQQYRSMNQVERHFEVLADDHATREVWLNSARFLTTRSDIQGLGGNVLIPKTACQPDKPAPPNGEPLRTRRNPSLVELLGRRTASLAASHSTFTCPMAVAAALWDMQASLPALHAAAALDDCRADHLVAAARLSVGDPSAAAEWSAVIRRRASSPVLLVSDLAPLWMFPDDPELQQTAEWLFTGPESPLSPTRRPDFVDSPLLAVPAFRQAVLSSLADSTTIGTATRSADRALSYRLGNVTHSGLMEPRQDPRQVQPGQERPVRVKDMVGWRLTNLDGAPHFDLDWPESGKDAVITEISEFLHAHGDELRAFPTRLQDTACIQERIYRNR
jgi:hypothetical protein